MVNKFSLDPFDGVWIRPYDEHSPEEGCPIQDTYLALIRLMEDLLQLLSVKIVAFKGTQAEHFKTYANQFLSGILKGWKLR